MTSKAECPDSLGRILTDDGRAAGTCFQISPGTLVTAWHVARDVAAPTVGSRVTVDPLAGGDQQLAEIVAVDQLRDLAVLAAPRPLPGSVVGLLASSSVLPTTPVLVTGVAHFADRHAHRFLSAAGTWQGLAMREDQVVLGRFESRGVARGMSGGPVCRVSDGIVTGVVSARYNTPDGWLRDTVWAARTEDLEPLLAGPLEPSRT